MSNTYYIVVGDEIRAKFSANWAQAADPILLNGSSTPFQVADVCHSSERAAEKLILWAFRDGAPIVDVDFDDDEEEIAEEYEVVTADDSE